MSIIGWLKSIFNEKEMRANLDPNKIRAKIDELEAETRQRWQEVNAIYAVTSVTADPVSDAVTFNPAKGILLKIFLNLHTGEFKFFPITMFE